MSSIRLLFPLIFAVQIFVAAGLTAAVAYMSQTREARQTAAEILGLIGDSMDEQLFDFLSTPVNLTAIVAEEVRHQPQQRFDDLLSPKAIDKLTTVIWAQSRLSRWVNLTLANGAGQSVRIDRKEYGKQILKMSDIRNGGDIAWHALGSRELNTAPIEVQQLAYDPRQQSYFHQAIAGKQRILTPVHFSPLVRGAPVVTVAEPVFDARGRLRVVVSSDIYLQGISAYLRGMRLPPSAVAFIFDRAGHLVASSVIEKQDYDERKEHADRKLLSVLHSADPVIRATGEHLLERLGDFTVPEVTSFQYISEKTHNYVYATHLFSEFGLDWNFAVVIAEDGLIQNLLTGIRWGAAISAVLLALAIAVGLVTAGWMIRPILTLRSVASALERDQLDDRHLHIRQLQKDTRRRDEFGQLAQTFLTMIREVRSRHALLESQLEQLRVGIDQEEVTRQVSLISRTEFFQNLKQKARDIRSGPAAAQTTSSASSGVASAPVAQV